MEDINQSNARAPGADDNASGVAAVLELARVLSKADLKNNIIQFVLFSG
jgi:Zn-dependent M28 family amino/carboxypeptidase